MQRRNLTRVSIAMLFLFMGFITSCTPSDNEKALEALATIPYVDRTKTEVDLWFSNRPAIVDDSMIGLTNDNPKVLFLVGPIAVNKMSYPDALCITQESIGYSDPIKYSALVGIKVLNNSNLFEAGEVELVSCDGKNFPPVNVANMGAHPESKLEQSFRNAVNKWLLDDIVKTLKSTTNVDGLANPEAPPRKPANARGIKYGVIEGPLEEVPPNPYGDKAVQQGETISFFAE